MIVIISDSLKQYNYPHCERSIGNVLSEYYVLKTNREIEYLSFEYGNKVFKVERN